MSKKIALDLDGVCYNYSATACYLLNHRRGYNLDWEQTSHWDWLKSQIKPEDWKWLWDEGVKEGLFRYGHLIKGAAEGVQELAKLGSVIVVTSRPVSAIKDTIDYLSFMDFPISGLHILSHGENKADLKPDVAIDDGPHNIEDYLRAGIKTVVFDQKYNREPLTAKLLSYEEQIDFNMYRAVGWKEVVLAAEHLLGL